ncbi:hypothetical protein C1646_762902, partial [Rhizophagus diaphanus]
VTGLLERTGLRMLPDSLDECGFYWNEVKAVFGPSLEFSAVEYAISGFLLKWDMQVARILR